MALIQTSLIWVAYVVAIAILLAISSVFVFTYQTPRDRAASVTTVCIFTTSVLLATILLLPVDVALISSTGLSNQGRKKDWATPEKTDSIVYTLKIVYYTFFSADAILCLLVIPFTYFWCEDYDEVGTEEGEQTARSRLWGAFKYTFVFVLLVVIIFLVGFFIPVAGGARRKHLDLDYFRQLLSENHGERALTFALGLLITLGILVYIVYTAPGLALLPAATIKSAPSVSAPTLAATTASQLDQNRERQRQLDRRNEGREEGLDARDRREFEALIREERTLIRRERLAAEAQGESSRLVKVWNKLGAIFRPVKLIGGLLLLLVSLLIFVSMLITGIDKAKNSICKHDCGYVLGHINIFQPINWVLVQTAKVFPIDYIIFLLLVLYLFTASVVGIATVGIRFLWVTIFKIRKAHTSPQALLFGTVLLALCILATIYSIAMFVAPQYATFGPQTYCDLPADKHGRVPSCLPEHRHLIKPCSEVAESQSARLVCTPSVVSTFLNRVTVNFPFFGIVDFWAQFVFLGAYLIVFVTMLFRTPKTDMDEVDRDLEEEEEESLLASTGRRFGATWQDITGRAKSNGRNYGTEGDITTNGRPSEDDE